ncbi:sensor histidine kinase [Anaerovorax odorimutans]|uniref:sensor histidine kinase n=1 Tax=Anaerovorax odorimutans TaxID=109327 RepID=UPI0004022A3F|nr:sensor histidine kinase [Anaerovorax odorimutans]
MKMRKKSLIKELKCTVLFLSAAMLAMWFLFYVNIHNVIQKNVMQNMEQVSEQIISELNRSFLQLEELSCALSQDKNVQNFLLEENNIEFVNKAAYVEETIDNLSENSSFMDNIIFYNEQGRFYRFSGTIGNTGVRRMMNLVEKDKLTSHIQIKLDSVNYIGYVTAIYQEGERIGTIVMLTNENDIYRLFEQMTENEDMKIAMAADGKVILSNEENYIGAKTEDIRKDTTYMVYKQVGFTPFELLISYEDSSHGMSILFMIAMLIMAVLLLLMLEIFLQFWKRKFFVPIQSIISEVEGFEGGKGAMLPMTGIEHFDGLVHGINDMVERIEQKEKEAYMAENSLQKAEIKKQKAMIISLKKQISAHFTVNVLNIIKALSAMGENEKAGLLCDGLSFLLRYANAGDSYISGMEEFFVLEKYTEIMEIRYLDKFSAEIEMEDALDGVELPRMLLQPIVENSILHGIVGDEKEGKGIVRVYSKIELGCLYITIEDNGMGMDVTQLAKLRSDIQDINQDYVEVEGLSHVALINIQRRILSYFGDEYGISVESSKGIGTTVTVRLPALRRGL